MITLKKRIHFYPIVGLLLLAYNRFSNYKKQESDATVQEQIVEYNKSFESYNKKAIKGTDMVSLFNLAYNRNKENEKQDKEDGYQNKDDGYPEIKIYIAMLKTDSGKYIDSYQNNYPIGQLYGGSKQHNNITYGLIDLDLTKTVDGKINKDLRNAFKLLYFECEEVVYEEKSGYIKEMYFKQVYDKNQN